MTKMIYVFYQIISLLCTSYGLLFSASSDSRCDLCESLVDLVKDVYFGSRSQTCLVDVATKICKLSKIQNDRVCEAVTKQFKDETLFIIGHLLLDTDKLCDKLRQFILPNCIQKHNLSHPQWTVSLPEKLTRNGADKMKPSNQTLRVLHLSDVHFDAQYRKGSEVDCDDPLCCRDSETETNKTPKVAAGKWGSVGKCDTPFILLENLFQHLKSSENFDYIIWTGDVPPHDVWNQTKTTHLESYDFLMRMFRKYFPNKPVFSTLGNHETSPVDSFPPHVDTIPKKYMSDWLYNSLGDHWTHWLPRSTLPWIRSKASYMTVLYPGLRLISINTNYCITTNFWLYLNDVDPDGDLAWLVEQLREAEKAGDKVHIIGHIPPGDATCLPSWSANYYRIINRFSDTIAAQFFGHTHADQVQVFYENYDYKQPPSNVLYVAPSITTFDQFMPAYRIYTIDGNYSRSSWTVLDYETHYANLTEANVRDKVEWKLLFTAKKTYDLPDLSAGSWSELIKRALENETLAKVLVKHYYRREDVSCDRNCTLDILCQMRSMRSHDKELCSDFPIDFEQSKAGLGHLSNVKIEEHLPDALALLTQCSNEKENANKSQNKQQTWATNQNCQTVERKCQSYGCGQICEGLVAKNAHLGQQSNLDKCSEAVCEMTLKCCCDK